MPRKITTTKVYSNDPDEEFLSGNGSKSIDPPPSPVPTVPPDFLQFKSRFINQKKSQARVYRRTAEGREYCFVDSLEAIKSEETLRQWHKQQKFAHEAGAYWIAVEYDGQVYDDYGPILIAPQAAEPVGGMQGPLYGGMSDYIHQRLTQLEQQANYRQNPSDLITLVDAVGRMQQLVTNTAGAPAATHVTADEALKWMEVGKQMGGAATEASGWSVLNQVIGSVAQVAGSVAQAMAPHLVPHLTTWWTAGNKTTEAPAPAPTTTPSTQPNPNPNYPNPVQRPDSPNVVQPVAPLQTPQSLNASPIADIPRLDLAHAPEDVLKTLRQGIDYLKGESKKGTHPGVYIDYVLTNDWKPENDLIISAVTYNDFSAFAEHVDQEIGTGSYREWFGYFYNGLRSSIIGSNPVAVDTAGAGGHGGHA